MNAIARLRIIVALFGLLALLPIQALAGMTPEEVKTFEEIKVRAERDDPDARLILGYCYANGHGVAKSSAQALSCFRRAADQGYAAAEFELGSCYFLGLDIEKDLAKATSWFRRAAEKGHPGSQLQLGLCYEMGKGVAKDQAQAVSWYRKAAEQGDARAQSLLGICYATGQGLAKDSVEAYAYFNLAGITFEEARKNLAILEKEMSPDARLLGQQRTKQLEKEISGRLETLHEIQRAAEKEKMMKGA